MLARDAILPNPLTVGPETTVLEFIESVLNSNQTTAAVLDGDKLVGMVSVKDVFQRIVPAYVDMAGRLADVIHAGYFEEKFEKFKHTRVRELMSTEIDSLRPDDAVIQAVAMFITKDRKTLPVLDGERFIGSLTRRSVLWMVTRHATS